MANYRKVDCKMAQWTSVVATRQLTRLLASQRAEERPGPLRVPAYRALADGIRLLVQEGRIPVAARIPAERELAAALSVSRTTVAAAFAALRAEGYLDSRRGAGSWTAVPAGSPLPTGGIVPLPPETAESVIDLGCASLPAPEPWLSRAVQSVLPDLRSHARTHGAYPAGLPSLRKALADRYTARGVPTMPEQVMVTTGAIGAVAAACQLLVNRGERIAVESPGYANVLEHMRRSGARLVPVAVAPALGGWELPAWRQAFRDAAPRMAYATADFHNPTGALADEDQRRDLVRAARAAGTVLVVDETMVDLLLEPQREMPRPVSSFDPGGSGVITVGSASKTFWSGLRVGWIRAAPDTIRRLVSSRAHSDLGSPVLEQLVVAWLLTGGGWDQVITERRQQIRGYRDDLVAAVRRELPAWEFQVPDGGLTLWARTGGLSGSRIAEAGERLGVRVPAGTLFGVDGAFEGFVRLPFTIGGALADEAASRIAAACRRVALKATADHGVPRTFVA